ncbi:MAG: SPOR domain-containing protein [Bacteroidales bacterium]|nr:SPOR domain-containing protein [Bacteroidales bacterium]
MALTQFIKDLLYTSDKLIIPGFGTFVAQYAPAQINSEKNIILPPAKYFIFDATLIEDDGVFVEYISRKKSLSLSEASQIVQEMVEDFHQKLKEGDTLLIEEVGYFSSDEKHNIRFQKENDKDFNADNFGLTPIVFKTSASQAFHIANEKTPAKKKPMFVKILIFFLIINVIGALTAVIYWKFEDVKTYLGLHAPEEEIKVPVYDSTRFIIKPDTSELGQTIDTLTQIKNALKYEAPKQDTVKKAVNTDARYYIIAGSFQSFKKAEAHAKILRKQGFSPEIIEFSQQLFRITVGEFKSKDEALSRLETVKKKKDTEAAWLLLK